MIARRLAIALVGVVLALAGCAQAPVTAAPAPTAVPTSAPTRAAATTPGAQGFAAGTRVSGTIQSVDAGKITLTDGATYSTTAQTRVTHTQAITATDLKLGMYVAVTAKRQPDNTLLASQVVAFSATPQGASTFQRPMTGGNLMTNATIDKLSGDSFQVTRDGGGANVKLAPDAKVQELVVGSLSDVKAGTQVTVQVNNGVAQAISLQ